MQCRERLGSDGAVVAEAFDAEQASVGSEADLFQIIEAGGSGVRTTHRRNRNRSAPGMHAREQLP